MTLLDYLIEVSQDPMKEEMFKKFRAHALENVALASEDKQLLLDNNWKAISQKLGNKVLIIIYENLRVTLPEFINALARSEQLKASFMADSSAFLKSVDLEAHDRELLTRGIITEVENALGRQLEGPLLVAFQKGGNSQGSGA
ncbi:hypothetical protein [Pyxidicoccus trucidator]|uniref:hypothetical protein n=1 Tax=Pyxidicoccus trucidator TaxID=2709662 RepID=UPI0013DC94B4|nr:hypothetical protein [Pyxidicoccus trucidator]